MVRDALFIFTLRAFSPDLFAFYEAELSNCAVAWAECILFAGRINLCGVA
jgi:hypothetical protein